MGIILEFKGDFVCSNSVGTPGGALDGVCSHCPCRWKLWLCKTGYLLKERLLYELYITGQRVSLSSHLQMVTSSRLSRQCSQPMCAGEEVFHAVTPAAPGHHVPVFTVAAVTVWLMAFIAMAMQYDIFQALLSPEVESCLNSQAAKGKHAYGPKMLMQWVNPKGAPWCYDNGGTFDADYLIMWGARWDPDLKHRPQRWLTSTIIHVSFMHIFSNAMLFAVLSTLMEMHHGTWRIATIWIVSAVGGNLLR